MGGFTPLLASASLLPIHKATMTAHQLLAIASPSCLAGPPPRHLPLPHWHPKSPEGRCLPLLLLTLVSPQLPSACWHPGPPPVPVWGVSHSSPFFPEFSVRLQCLIPFPTLATPQECRYINKISSLSHCSLYRLQDVDFSATTCVISMSHVQWPPGCTCCAGPGDT